ncbi:putative ABC transporter permease [Lawsonibacter sp. LCP25S3_F5]
MYQFLWIFFVYAFLGWCTEVSYAALRTGKFVNRGFLNGPVCPIYGCGVVVVLVGLTPLKGNFVLLFLGSVVLTSVLELATGFVLEKLFRQRWWDYSDKPFNLGGYICLEFSIMWGFACLFVVDILHPSIEFFIRLIPHTLGWVLLGLFSAAMAVDLAATVRTIAKLNRQLDQIDQLARRLKTASNEFGENLADRVLEAAERSADWKEDWEAAAEEWSQRRAEFQVQLAQRKERLEGELAQKREQMEDELRQHAQEQAVRLQEGHDKARAELDAWREKLQTQLDSRVFGQRRLMAAFPKMRSTRHRQAMEQLRRRMERRAPSKRK